MAEPAVPEQRNVLSVFRQAMYKVLTSSALQSRAAISSQIGKSFHGKRDLYEALGYPNENELNYDKCYAHYLRGVSRRLINAEPEGCLATPPDVLEPKAKDTPFEREWAAMVKRLRLWNIFVRTDKLARIGEYGILLMGFDDVRNEQDLSGPVKKGGKRRLLYVQPYGQGSAPVDKWDEDPNSERYGLPETYKVTVKQLQTGTSNLNSTKSIIVHYSRVLHIVEDCLESNVYGMPYLKAGFNRLLDIEKVVGGSAEGFWQGAFPGYAFVPKEGYDFTDTGDGTGTTLAESLEAEIDLFVHDFKRYMKLIGLDVTKLSPDVAEPDKHVDVLLKMLSIIYGIPLRILTGSERGQLASTQDEAHWNDSLKERCTNFLEPVLVRPFIDKCIDLGVLPEPGKDGYEVEWPDLNSPTDKDVAEVGKARSGALKDYATSGPDMEMLVPIDAFLSEILGLSDEAVERIRDAREKALKEMMKNDLVDENGQETIPSGKEEGSVEPEEGELDQQTVE